MAGSSAGLRAFHFFALAALVSACVSPAADMVSPAPSTPTLEPDLAYPIEAELAPATEPGEWFVLGIVQGQAQAVAAPRIVIVLRAEAGGEIARRTVEIPVDPLASAAAWPFQELFRPSDTPASVDATLVGNAADEPAEVDIAGSVLRTFLDAQGGPVALGSLSNPAPTAATIDRLRLLGRDSAGRMRQVLDAEPGADPIEAIGRVPFLLPLPPGSDDLAWEVFPIARPATSPRPFVAIHDVRPGRDAQDHPFVTATVRNDSPTPLWLSPMAIAMDGETWLAGESIMLPVPLASGDETSFSLRVPGIGPTTGKDIRWLFVSRQRPAEDGPIRVPSEVIGYEPVGSTLFLRVQLSGVEGAEIAHPSARASITDDEGGILSAAWGEAPNTLAADQTALVTLALPLPAGFDLTQAELDVEGAGLLQ